jgi:hypothetical protein
MKFLVNITMAIFLCLNSLVAQGVDPLQVQDTDSLASQVVDQQIRISRVWVSYYSSKSKYSRTPLIRIKEGALYQVADSSILVSSSLKREDYSTNNFTVASVNISDIEGITLREKGAAGKGAIFGAVSGLLVGVFVGGVIDDGTPSSGFQIISSGGLIAFFAGTGTLVGTGVGALLGASAKINIPINRSMDKYEKKKSRLRRYAIHR